MLEIIGQSLEDAKKIEDAGAHRIELVSGISEGGLTPSYAMIQQVIEQVKIPVNVMVRPHSYSFSYSKADLSVMKEDIRIINSLGANAIVLGCLVNQKVSQESLNALIESVDCQITFHRALDESIQLLEDYKHLAQHDKITQILTSAGLGNAYDHLHLLDEMYALNPNKLLIGSGVGLNNIAMFYKRYPKANFHIGSDIRHHQCFSQSIDENRLKEILKIIS